MSRVLAGLASFALALAAACGSAAEVVDPGPGVACTLEARAGIILTAFDSISGQALPTTGTVVAQDGSYSEKALAIPGSPTRYVMAFERPATYTVTVSVDGFQQWKATGVVVARDLCHVIAVELSARLVH